MALNKTALKDGLKALRVEMRTREADAARAGDDYDDAFVDLLAAFIQSASITGAVSTTGTATAQTGTITSATIQ
jgi:hypothetical protein